MACMSYSEFDAGLVCMNCMQSALLSCDSNSSSESDLPTNDRDFESGLRRDPTSYAEGVAWSLKLETMDAKLDRATRKLTHRGPVEEPACQALVAVACEGLVLARRLAGKIFAAEVGQMQLVKSALGLALRAVDKLPRSYNTASHLPAMLRESLGTSWTELAAAVVHAHAGVCLASGNWSQAAASCRRLLEAGPATDLAFCRRCCTPATRASPFHDALAGCPDYRAFRAGWLEQAVRRPGSHAVELLFAGRARGPVTFAVLTGFKDVVGLWQRAILSFTATEDGLRCLGCGAGSFDCVCGEESVSEAKPTDAPPPLAIEQTVLPNIGSAVQISGPQVRKGCRSMVFWAP